ncbi:MAG: hypothetical protein HGA86_06650 [Anaerolineaceae bacterium]|nr:hypothetical protein [Anaerolineaceae bacterium]
MNASAMPTEQIKMYFHEASTEVLLTFNGMMKAEKMVVASIAIHIRPTLLAETASSMEAMNRLMKIWKRRSCAWV